MMFRTKPRCASGIEPLCGTPQVQLFPLFHPERFKEASRYYTAGRPTYPKQLARRVAELVGLAGENVLDLGTGPGFLAIDFAPLANMVTAIDPSPEMLAAASHNAERARVQIKLVHGSSYELGAHLGRFKLVTIGRVSLDGAQTHDPARPLLRSDVINEAVLLDSSFDRLERIGILEVRQTPVERFVDRALSFAATWRGRPGSREQDLALEIQNALAPYADGSGIVREVLEGHALIARRSRDIAE